MNDKFYCVTFEYKNEDTARDFFNKIADFLLSLDELNQVLVAIFNPCIQTHIQIEFLEKGSIKVWIKDVITKIDDDDIKKYVKNPKEIISDLLIKIKAKILQAIDDEKCENLPVLVEKEIEKSELRAYGYGIKKTKLLSSVSKLTHYAKEFKNKPMLVIKEVSYTLEKKFDYDILKNATTQISKIDGEFIIKKPDLAGDSKWEVITDKIIKAKIDDEHFVKDLKERRITLSCGDKIKATLLTKTHIDENLEIIESEYFLTNIQGIVPPQKIIEQKLPYDK